MASKKVKSKTTGKKSKKVTTKAEVAVVAEERQDVDLATAEPRRALFLQLYYDRESPTWGNAKQSAIAAGFDEDYANQITYRKPEWWLGVVRQMDVSGLIEQHFTEVMMLPTVTQAMGAFGPIEKKMVIEEDTGEIYKSGKRKGQAKTKKRTVKVPVMVPNVSIIKEKTAVAKIAAPAHNPDMYGKKDQKKFSFSYNVLEVRNRYKPS